MNDYLAALKLFVRVARRGSFSAAGRDLNMPQPTVSRIISSLEQEVGVHLINRTTRAVSLTEAGTEFLERLDPILAALEEAEESIRGDGQLRGTLRLGLSSSFALRAVVPTMTNFLAGHPQLRVEYLLDDMRQNLTASAVDVSIRFGSLADSTAVTRKLGSTPRVIVASPAYLAQLGTPQEPEDLNQHRIIIGPMTTGQSWSFRRDGQVVSVRFEGTVTTSFNEASTASAVAGIGITCLSLAGCQREITAGELVRLLPDWDMGSIDINALFPAGRFAKPAAKAYIDYLRGQVGQFGIV
jgi:DNA-binding transcriptional LysR family regulator